MRDRLHRDLPDIPTDPADRRQEIKWVLGHKLWTHPDTIRKPPSAEDLFEPVEGMDNVTALRPPQKDWVEVEFDNGSWMECVDIEVVYVDPETETIEDDESRNTAFRVWIEAGGWYDQSIEGCIEPEGGWNKYNRWCGSHNPNLNCGAPTLEEALLELARLVRFFYGEGREHLETAPENCGGDFENFGEADEKYIDFCRDAGDGFCAKCGYRIEEHEDE